MKPTPRTIVNETSREFTVEPARLFSPCRKRQIVDCRHFSMLFIYLIHGTKQSDGTPHKPGQLGTHRIGLIFRRDHATVIHGVRKSLDLIETDKCFREKFEKLARILITD